MATPIKLNAITNAVVRVRENSTVKLRGGSIFNPSNAAAYLQLFDAKYAQDVTLGTTVPKLSIACPTLSSIPIPLDDAVFAKGCFAAFTTTAGGNAAPSSAGDVNLSID